MMSSASASSWRSDDASPRRSGRRGNGCLDLSSCWTECLRTDTAICEHTHIHTMMQKKNRWLGSLVVRVLDLRLEGHDSRPPLPAKSGIGKPPQHFTKPTKPTQPPTLSGTGNEYPPKCSDALQLGFVKASDAHSACGWTCGWQAKLCDPSLTHVPTWALYRWVPHTL